MRKLLAVILAVVAAVLLSAAAPAQARPHGQNVIHATPYDTNDDGGSWSWCDCRKNSGTIYAIAPSKAYRFWTAVMDDQGVATFRLRSHTARFDGGLYGSYGESPAKWPRMAGFWNVVLIDTDGSRRFMAISPA